MPHVHVQHVRMRVHVPVAGDVGVSVIGNEAAMVYIAAAARARPGAGTACPRPIVALADPGAMLLRGPGV